jgi:hypothetical protein
MTETETMEPQQPAEAISDWGVLYAMRRIVDEYGRDYVYKDGDHTRACVYREDGKPSCLVGQVLARLTPDHVPAERSSVPNQREALHKAGYSRVATYALHIAQRVQDARHTWGAALDAATAVMEHPPAAW